MTQVTPKILKIDGAQGEGGGQILRTSMALSAILQQPIEIENIRANRDKPGLRPQHLTGVETMGALCDAQLEGATLGSSALRFVPRSLPHGAQQIDIGTAGSTSLLLHALYFSMAWGQEGGSFTLIGGTHNEKAPTFDYLEQIWQPMLGHCGYQTRLSLSAFGFYPKGGGQIQAEVPGTQPDTSAKAPLHWIERPPLDRVEIRALWAEPKRHKGRRSDIPERMAQAANQHLLNGGITCTPDLVTQHETSASAGAISHVFLHFGPIRAGFTAWGRRGLPAEKVGARVAQEALDFLETGACVEEHASDQLLLPLALAKQDAAYTTPVLSGHLHTNAAIIESFLPHIKISFSPHGDNTLVQVTNK